MNILVTGISAGIGNAICKAAMQSNHNVIGLSRSQNAFEELQKYAASHQVLFKGVKFSHAHLQEENTEELYQVLSQISGVDVLINNAGLLEKQSFNEMDLHSLQRMMDVNLYYPMVLTRWLKTKALYKEHAHIVNIGSMGGFQGSAKFPGLLGYSASKAALAAFTECLAEEWHQESVTINCLCLGAVQTEMLSQAFPDYTAQVLPEQMAEFVVDFAIRRPSMFNGKVLPVAQNNP